VEYTDPSQLQSVSPPVSSYHAILPLPPLPPGNIYQQGVLGYYDAEPRKPAVWTVFVVLAVTLLLYVGVSLATTVLYASLHHAGEDGSETNLRDDVLELMNDPAGIATLAVAAQLTFLTVTLVAAWLSPMGIVRRLRLGTSGMSWLGYLTLPVGMLAINTLFELLVNLSNVSQEGGNLDVIHNMIQQLSPGFLVVMVLVIGVLPGFAEEFLFRGYVQSRLAVRWGRGLAIFTAAALFGLFHFDRIQSPATFLMGLYLGYVAERAGSIRPSMFAHFFNNATVVIVSWWAGRNAVQAAASTGTANLKGELLEAAGCVMLIALCCVYLKYRVRPPEQREGEERTGGFPVSVVAPTA
jgi:membrane protease YdiL (CAAX protease family)